MPKNKKPRRKKKKPKQNGNKGTQVVTTSPRIKEANSKKVEVIEAEKKEVKEKKTPKPKKLKKALFAFIWLYLISKLIFSDFDALTLPELLGISTTIYVLLRLLITIGLIVLIWLKLGNMRFWKNVGWFLLFPIYPVGWKILKNGLWDFPNFAFQYKLDFLLFNYFDMIVSFAVKFKSTLLRWVAFIMATIIMFTFTGVALYIPIFLFSILEIAHLYKRWRELFGPIKLFQININKVNIGSPFTKEVLQNQLDRSLKASKEKSKKDMRIRTMENLVLMREFMKIFDVKIQNVISSRAYMKSFIVKAFYSVIYAMIIFTGINYCLHLIDASHFVSDRTSLRYFDFLYYSFFTIIPDGTFIEPISVAALSVKMLGVIIGYGINILIFAIYIGSNSKKYQENLKEISIWSSNSHGTINQYYKERYGKDPTEGYKWLREQGSKIESSIEGLKKLFRQKK